MIALAAAALLGAAAPAPPPVWSRGDRSVWTVPCRETDDPEPDHCSGLELREGGRVRRLGEGYLPGRYGVKVLWRRGASGPGPDVIVSGYRGGTDGCLDVWVVSGAAPARVQRLHPCHDDLLQVETRTGRPVMDVAFAIEGFRGASNADATVVPLPLRWTGSRFDLDLARLSRREPDAEVEALRFRAVANGLSIGLQPDVTAGLQDAQPAVQGLAGLMLTGRADEARRLLDRVWPGDLIDTAGRSRDTAREKEVFWSTLCAAMVRHPMWRELRLDRLPHADLIAAGARTAPAH